MMFPYSRELQIYRTTPQATTNVSPCELLMGRALHTRFDMLRPSVEKRVKLNRSKGMMYLAKKVVLILFAQEIFMEVLSGFQDWSSYSIR